MMWQYILRIKNSHKFNYGDHDTTFIKKIFYIVSFLSIDTSFKNYLSSFQFRELEEQFQGKEDRQKFRKCVYSLIAMEKFASPLHAARRICRVIAPDSLFQNFTREPCSRSSKCPLVVEYPKLNQNITTLISVAMKVSMQKAPSGLSLHLSKCGDRKESKKNEDSQ